MTRIDVGGGTSSYDFYPSITPAQTQTAQGSPTITGIVQTDASPNTDNPTPAPQTAKDRTDAAIAAYDAAVNGTDDTMLNAPRNAALRQDMHDADVDQAKTALNKAISDELSGRNSDPNSKVPPGQDILQRHANGPAARAAITDALLANPSVKAWIDQAAQNIDKPYQGIAAKNLSDSPKQAQAAAAKLQSTVTGLEPEMATAVMQASLPTIQKISKLLVTPGTNVQAFHTLQSTLSSIGDGPRAQSLIDQVANCYSKNEGLVDAWGGDNGYNTIFADNMADAGKGDTRLARSLADLLQRSGSSKAPAIRTAAYDGLYKFIAGGDGSPLVAYNEARKNAQTNTDHLSQLLAETGPLTPEQQQNFIKAYMSAPENADVYKKESEAAKNLADYMNANRDSLIAAAGQRPDSANQLYQCMQALTQSGQGTTALSFIGAINNDPAASKAFGSLPNKTQNDYQGSDFKGKFLDDTIAAAQGELLVEKNGDAQSAVNSLLQLAEPAFSGVNGWDKLSKDYGLIANVKADPHIFDPKVLADDLKEMGLGKRGFAMASIMVSAYNGSNAGTVSGMIGSYASAGVDTAELGSGALKFLADSDRVGYYTKAGAAAAADFTAKFIPGLSLIASVSSIGQDAGKVTGDPLYAGAVLGDVFSIGGSVAELLPGGELGGELANSLGLLISSVSQELGSFVDGLTLDPKLKGEAKNYLEKANQLSTTDGQEKLGILDKTRMPDQTDQLDDKTINALVQSDPSQVLKLQSLKMSAADIQGLAEDDPEWLKATSKSDFLIDLAQATGMQGAEVIGFAEAVEKDNPNIVGINPDMPDAAPPTQNQLIDLIGQQYPTAKGYVQVHNADVFGPGGTPRRKANGDFDGASLMPGPQEDQQIAELLNHNSDPAYQAQIINRLQQGQTLDRWVWSVRQTDGTLPTTVQNAIEAAKNAGVLSQNQVDTYLNKQS